MAKGEGKGDGKGERRHEINGECNICGCICLMVIIPPILIVAGICMLASTNTRVERILHYNSVVDLWNKKGYDNFKNQNFTAKIGKTYVLNPTTATSGSYWPVRDSCSYDEDPEGGCTAVSPYSYISDYIDPSYTEIILSSNGTRITDKTFSLYSYVTVSRSQVCDSDDSDSYCESRCRNKGGQWTGSRCRFTYYLSNICFRVRLNKDGTDFELDNPPEHLLSSSYNAGCYYGAGGFSPYSYYYTSPNAYRVEVRLNTDPVVAASDSTYGCSDSSYSNSQCFGMTRKDQNSVGIWLIVIGIIVLLIDACIITALVFCCKDMLNSCMPRNRRLSTYNTATYHPPVTQAYTTTTTTTTYPPNVYNPAAIPTATVAGGYPMATTAIPTATVAGGYPAATTAIPTATTAIPTASIAIPTTTVPNTGASASVNAPLLTPSYYPKNPVV